MKEILSKKDQEDKKKARAKRAGTAVKVLELIEREMPGENALEMLRVAAQIQAPHINILLTGSN